MSWDEFFDRWFSRRMRMPFRFFDFGFEDMERMFEEMLKEMTADLPRDLFRERKLEDGTTVREVGPFVYGYSMTIGPDGKPVIREFGNVKPSRRPTIFGEARPRLQFQEEREPLVDIVEGAEDIRVVVELPGVEKKDIQLSCTETQLSQEVLGQATRTVYSK
ncbi:MAG: Hsp20/alpha crystallin family protein [Candidatus Bathyarchaeia archaeon]